MATTLQPTQPDLPRTALKRLRGRDRLEAQALIDLVLSGLTELRQIPNPKRLHGPARARAQATIDSIRWGFSELRNLTTNTER